MIQQLIKRFMGCCTGFLWFSCVMAQPNINRVEYYIDNDPGYGKATAISFTPGTNLSNLTADIDPGTVGTGVHIFGIRAKDANNKWSLDNKWLFAKNATVPATPNIIKVEYYIDADPGYGKATDTVLTPGTNLTNLTHSINPASISPGVHIFGIRAKDGNGAWSLDNKGLFVKDAPGVAVSNIIKIEYYIDTDPGYGKATDTAITPGTNLANLTHSINPAALSPGVHIFGIRAKDGKGAWSLDNKWLFVKDAPGVAVSNIIKIEYYIDTDPGYGKATDTAITPGTNLANLTHSINPAALSPGIHIFGVRAKDANGKWSLDNKWLFLKEALPAGTPNIVKVEYYIDTDPGYGKALQANITPSANLVNIIQDINVGALAGGAHVIGIRALDSKGGWSLDNKLLFTIPAARALPIVLSNFNGRYANHTNELTGVIQQPVNVKAVEVEKSTDGAHFKYLDNMTAASVTSGTYQYQDKNPATGNNFYRLRIIDINGTVSYSYSILLSNSSRFIVRMYPNPVEDNLIVHFENSVAGIYNIRVTDILGREILTHRVNIAQNNQAGEVNISFNRCAAGTYFIEVRNELNKIVTTRKIIKK